MCDGVCTQTCCRTHIVLWYSSHISMRAHTHGSRSHEKGVCSVYVVSLHLVLSSLMFQSPSLLFPDGHFDDVFQTFTSAPSLPGLSRPKSAGPAHFRTGEKNLATWPITPTTQRQTETARDSQTETDRDRQRQAETDRDRQRQTETDRDRQRQTETDRDRQRQTDKQTASQEELQYQQAKGENIADDSQQEHKINLQRLHRLAAAEAACEPEVWGGRGACAGRDQEASVVEDRGHVRRGRDARRRGWSVEAPSASLSLTSRRSSRCERPSQVALRSFVLEAKGGR